MHITAAMIRGARAMVQMSQSELAKAAGLSKAAIANIENSQVDPRVSTLDAIQKALENAGVEFMADGAVKLRRITP